MNRNFVFAEYSPEGVALPSFRSAMNTGCYPVPAVIAQSNVPAYIAPSGTMGANGAVTLGTALSATYSSGIYLLFPAGAVFSGSALGFYWTVMSSTTVGTVFNNPMGLIPTIPATPVPIVDVGPGAYTGSIAAATAFSATVPGGLLGANGQLVLNVEFTYNLVAGNKTISKQFGGVGIASSVRTTTGGHDGFTDRIKNAGRQDRQFFSTLSESASTGTGGILQGSIDTSQDQSFLVRIVTDTPTNWIGVHSVSVMTLPAP